LYPCSAPVPMRDWGGQLFHGKPVRMEMQLKKFPKRSFSAGRSHPRV
jgi:hypothetical protein